ncbi:MAG: 3-deoxy-manno-octulosonate cytidylyltransferase [Candidatus Anoxychlamydiales bacterium]|nr:3-deoxy-manno-octulosonate cytidylyltransferase [Candidatus Anoxychlamydiales bacterium]
MKNKVIAIIPARYESLRFPKKLLYKINGKSILEHTYLNAKKCASLDDIYIATDSKIIFDMVKKFNAKCLMTSVECKNGTDRIIEAIENYELLNEANIIVNVQGDHPKIEPETIDLSIKALLNDESAIASTAVTKINYSIAKNENVVKCVFDCQNNALYFSRSLIPHSKNFEKINYYYHIGLYVYKKDFLLKLKKLKETKCQLLEDLEQLKILENGYKMKVAIVNDIPLSVDVFEDIKKVEKILCQ